MRRYEEVLLPTYEARRGRLVDNLESVERELPMWLSEGYQRMLLDLLGERSLLNDNRAAPRRPASAHTRHVAPRVPKPTPLPRSRLDEVLRAGISERSTPRALQPASVDVLVYTRIPTGGEPNKDYMQGMLWAQYPPPDPDTPMGRGRRSTISRKATCQ